MAGIARKKLTEGQQSLIARVREKYYTDRIQVEVPEWDETLYFPKISSRAAQMTENKAGEDELERQVKYLIRFAQTEDGERAFADEDFEDVMEMAELQLIGRVIVAVMEGTMTDKEADALVQHDPLPSSTSASPSNSASPSPKSANLNSTNSPSGQPTSAPKAMSAS
jgi:hypothetical protein